MGLHDVRRPQPMRFGTSATAWWHGVTSRSRSLTPLPRRSRRWEGPGALPRPQLPASSCAWTLQMEWMDLGFGWKGIRWNGVRVRSEEQGRLRGEVREEVGTGWTTSGGPATPKCEQGTNRGRGAANGRRRRQGLLRTAAGTDSSSRCSLL